MTLLPLIFIVGPSGVGKSTVSNWIETDLRFLHVDIDIHRPFRNYGLQREAHTFFSIPHNPAPLASNLRGRAADAKCAGAVISFPSTRILTRKLIDVAESIGILTIVLWGPMDLCKKARRERDLKDGHSFDEVNYDKSNRKAFDTYGKAEYDDVRLEAFPRDRPQLRDDTIRW